MASKGRCLRCPELKPGQLDLYKHGDNLAKCQKEIKADGKPYNLDNDLWPLFNGKKPAAFKDKDEAHKFIEPVIQGVRDGIDQPWSKGTMEAAAQLAFPASEASKKKQKGNVAHAMSSLTLTAPGPSSSGPEPSPGVTSTSAPPTSTTAVATITPSTTTSFTSAAPTVASGPTTLADPSGPHFMIQKVQKTNQAAANQYVRDLAGRLADAEHNDQQRRDQTPDDKRTQLSKQQRDDKTPSMIRKYGLRSGFATPDPGALIETNYLSMEFPQRIYVYHVEMIRGTDNRGNPILVKKQWDQLKVLQTITFAQTPYPQYSTALNTNSLHWVSDGSTIWSTVALFNADLPSQEPGPLISTPAQTVRYENETGVFLDVDRVDITFRQEFDLTRPVGELFFDATAATFSESAPSILTRGLNAFFTRYVRDRSDPVVPHQTIAYARSGFNKSFPTTGGAAVSELDGNRVSQQTLQAISGFSLSVRPGVQAMYVNVSIATSPFFKNVTVQQFIERCIHYPQGRSAEEVFRALKGIKVRIAHHTRNDQITFPQPNSRFRFINGIVDRADQAPTSPSRYDNPQVRNAAQWYAKDSPYRTRPEFPHTAVPQFPGLYFVNVGKDPAIGPNNVEWYPATALEIAAYQPFPGRLMRSQTTQMIDAALRPPDEHKRAIVSSEVGGSLNHFAFSGAQAGNQQGGLGNVQMSAGIVFTQIPGRWLKPPTICYSTPRDERSSSDDLKRAAPSVRLQPKGASWDLRYSAFASTNVIGKIPVLKLSRGNLPPFQTNLLRQLRKHGLIPNLRVQVDVRNISINYDQLTRDWEVGLGGFANKLMEVWDDTKRYPVLVVLEDFSYDLYASIKRVGDIVVGVPTICVRRETIDNAARGDLQRLSNIALKFNMKTGGTNHYLAGPSLQPLRSGQTIVIGADVTHPNNTSRSGTPSIAAVVGSADDNFMKFPGSMRLQQSKKEDIVDLAQMVKERLLAWARCHNNQLPANVLFYRDGVSESQYDIVRRRELPQIQTAMNLAYMELKAMAQGQNPDNSDNDPPGMPPQLPEIDDKLPMSEKLRRMKEQEEKQASCVESNAKNRPLNLTFIVVGKRHNTRFYPTRPTDEAVPSRNRNVKPGLVVDQVITHPYSTDFYLQSHFPIKGTGRSAHYFVLRNNIGLSVDDLQTITHTFCYAYARATKGVSYCAPAYYADRLCDRGRAYLRHFLVNKNLPEGVPNKGRTQSWDSFKLDVKNNIHNRRYYRPRPAEGENRWDPFLNDMMFYL